MPKVRPLTEAQRREQVYQERLKWMADGLAVAHGHGDHGGGVIEIPVDPNGVAHLQIGELAGIRHMYSVPERLSDADKAVFRRGHDAHFAGADAGICFLFDFLVDHGAQGLPDFLRLRRDISNFSHRKTSLRK